MKIFFIILILHTTLQAQTGDDVIESIADRQLFNSESEDENAATMENVTQLLIHKVDLNSCGQEQLRLFGLSETQIQNFIEHRARHGNLVSIYELQSIDNFDEDLIRQLQKVSTIRDPTSTIDQDFLKRVKTDGYSYALLRSDLVLQKKNGFTNSVSEEMRFMGPRNRTSFRIRTFRAGDFSFGITAENDPGEKFRWSPSSSQYGFDFIAVHAQVQNKGFIKNLIVGDYQAQFGQGLVWGGAMAFGKGAEAITNVRRINIGFVPYTSAYEGAALHGAATSLQIRNNFTAHLLVSSSKRDASLGYRNDESFISSFQSSGLHRNSSELEKRKIINQNLLGAALDYNHNNLVLGATIQYMDVGLPIEPRKSLYNQFTFRGTQNTNASVFVSYSFHNVSFFSETARSANGGRGIVGGGLFSLTPKFDLSVLYRDYQKNYISFNSNAFSENTSPSNEKGFYWGWKYKANRRYFISGYVDFFTFPWLKFRTYKPSAGNEWLAHVHWQPVRSTNIFFQVRQENKFRNESGSKNSLYRINAITKNSYWFHAEYYLTPAIRMKTRIQWSSFYQQKKISEGFVIAEDFSVTQGKLKATGRYAIFDTDDYDNRQYLYENDVWLSYSLPAYSGRGIRKYVLLQYKLNKTFTFWLRYGHTRYLNKKTIGSGVEMINGNQQNDIRFEVRIQF